MIPSPRNLSASCPGSTPDATSRPRGISSPLSSRAPVALCEPRRIFSTPVLVLISPPGNVGGRRGPATRGAYRLSPGCYPRPAARCRKARRARRRLRRGGVCHEQGEGAEQTLDLLGFEGLV